jgi:hypothetical protein
MGVGSLSGRVWFVSSLGIWISMWGLGWGRREVDQLTALQSFATETIICAASSNRTNRRIAGGI